MIETILILLTLYVIVSFAFARYCTLGMIDKWWGKTLLTPFILIISTTAWAKEKWQAWVNRGVDA